MSLFLECLYRATLAEITKRIKLLEDWTCLSSRTTQLSSFSFLHRKRNRKSAVIQLPHVCRRRRRLTHFFERRFDSCRQKLTQPSRNPLLRPRRGAQSVRLYVLATPIDALKKYIYPEFTSSFTPRSLSTSLRVAVYIKLYVSPHPKKYTLYRYR